MLHMSERHACRVIGQHRSTQRRPEPRNPYRDRLVARMRCLAQANPRRGRKHILDLLHGEGWRVGTRLMKRLWRAGFVTGVDARTWTADPIPSDIQPPLPPKAPI
jgi:hypothetical protein